MPPQHHNATMPELSEKSMVKVAQHNTTLTVPEANPTSRDIIQSQDMPGNNTKLNSIPKSEELLPLAQPVYRKTVLDTVNVGNIIQIISNFEIPVQEMKKEKGQPTSSPAVFSATCFQDEDLPVLEYVLGTLQDEKLLSQIKPLDQLGERFEEGKVVIAFDEAENAFCRYIYLKPDVKINKATLFNIDSPKEVQNVAFDKILPAEPEVYSYPALGFKFVAIGVMTASIQQRVREIALKETFEAKILYVNHFEDGRLKHLTAALLNSDKKPIMSYKITPYFMDTKVAEFLKIQKADVATSLKGVKLTVDEQVHGIWDATVKFGQWSDFLLLMRIQDVERRKELQSILQKCCANAPPIVIYSDTNAQELRGQLVACKFSRDGQYYRAVVTGIKPDKARLNFIDFGNQEGTSYKITYFIWFL